MYAISSFAHASFNNLTCSFPLHPPSTDINFDASKSPDSSLRRWCKTAFEQQHFDFRRVEKVAHQTGNRPFLFKQTKRRRLEIKSSDKENFSAAVEHHGELDRIIYLWTYHTRPNRPRRLSCMDVFRQPKSGHWLWCGSHFLTTQIVKNLIEFIFFFRIEQPNLLRKWKWFLQITQHGR